MTIEELALGVDTARNCGLGIDYKKIMLLPSPKVPWVKIDKDGHEEIIPRKPFPGRICYDVNNIIYRVKFAVDGYPPNYDEDFCKQELQAKYFKHMYPEGLKRPDRWLDVYKTKIVKNPKYKKNR